MEDVPRTEYPGTCEWGELAMGAEVRSRDGLSGLK